MTANWKKATTMILCTSLLSVQGLPVYAAGTETSQTQSSSGSSGQEGQMPGSGGPGGQMPDGNGGPGGQMPDGNGGPGGQMSESDVAGTGNSISKDALLSITDGTVTTKEGYEDLAGQTSDSGGTTMISDISIEEGSYSATGIVSENSDTLLKNISALLNVEEPAEDVSSAGTAVYTDSGTVRIEDSRLTVNGAGRYTVAAEGDATLIVNDSVITAGGDAGADGNTSAVSEPSSNAGLLISGTSRANFSVGQTHTFYYNSLCLAEGWAALSTDSATGSGLEFIGYNTDSIALHGGYGIYSDTNCRDYLYGVRLLSAEVGAIISNNGSITIGSSGEAGDAVTQDGIEVLSNLSGEETSEDTRSVIIAGRNDFQLHSPDMMGEGNSDYSAQLSVSNADLITDDSINGDGYSYTSDITGETCQIQATENYAEKYSDAVGAYIDYVSGAAILAKSTSADITLDNVTVDSYSGIAVLSALNSDSMSRYLRQDAGNGVNVSITDSEINGSFVHDDYQRDMNITADASTLTGAVTYADANQWNKFWSDYADDENCCWYNLSTDDYVTNTHETTLTLTGGSVWNVTGASRLTSLSVSADSVVNGSIEAESSEEQEDGTMLYTNAVVTSGDGSELALNSPSVLELSEEDIVIDTTVVTEAGSSSQEQNEGPGSENGQAPDSMGGPGGNGQTPSDKPDGNGSPGGDGGQAPDGMGGPGGSGNGGPGGDSGSSNENVIGSWSSGGEEDYDYDSALYVTADGISEEDSSADRITEGTYDAENAAGVVISDSESGHNGILVNNTSYTISDSTIELLTDADGSDTCDFSGKGSAIAVFGSDADVTVENSEIHTAGVATMPVFADDGASVTIKNSILQSDGGTLHQSYMNTPDQALMVAPPWILGIMGTSRTTNMMGDDTTTNVIDSETSAGAWAVLSTDAGSDMYLNVYNSSLTLNNTDESQYLLQEEGGEISETLDNPYTENYGSGYGTYAIGDAVETFAGSVLNVGTYATIFTGGTGIYTALEEGVTYALQNSAGETTAEYTAEENKVTEIHSDTFGFMAHQSSNHITIDKGTVVDSGYATFLVKTGSSNETLTADIDDAVITNGGVLVQVMDNDDATNGGMMSTDDELNTNGGSQNFIPYHTEDAGFNTDAAQQGSSVQTFTFTNGTYDGSLYNASGSDGLEGSTLSVTLGEGAVLNGAAASTSAIHVTYDGSALLKENGCLAFDNAEEAAAFAEEYQNTEFTINEYFSIGHVANLINDNGANAIEMNLTSDAVWNVTATSLISSLTIEDQAQVIIPEGVTLTVNGTEYTNCTLTAESFS